MGYRRIRQKFSDVRLVGRLAALRFVAPAIRSLRAAHNLIEPAADRLTIAPQDLRTADPTVADDIYAGIFTFSGQIVECRGQSPFEVFAPTEDWARMLHGFGWLRHLRAADTAVSRHNARILVDDWLRTSEHQAIAWDSEVAARRLMAWLAQSPMILQNADPAFYHRFLAGLTRHFRRLRNRLGEEPDGLPRLKVAVAVLAAAITVEGFRRWVKSASRHLEDELKRQILPDGGHVARNPTTILEILIDLLPIRQAMAARGFPVSPVIMSAIDRMMPMLRFFRHSDGAFALFNGATTTPTDQLATVLAYDDGKGAPHGNAPHSGYQRLEAGGTVVIVDTGRPPPPELAQLAHAGTLSFELSSGGSRLVVNCGAPFRPIGEWRRVARATAAHSTLVVDDHSSATIREKGPLVTLLGPVLVAGPDEVTVERRDDEEGLTILASHDGYATDFGLRHERTLRLSPTGDRLDGRDAVVAADGEADDDAPFVVRFHLHPSVHVDPLAHGGYRLTAAFSECWDFVAYGVTPALEDSVYLADIHGIRRTRQIALVSPEKGPREIAWSLVRVGPPR